MKKLLLLMFPLAVLLLSGCKSLEADPDTLEMAALVGANEAVLADSNNRAVLEETATVLDLFCGQTNIDALALTQFLESRLGNHANGRVVYIYLAFKKASEHITPADYVQWGNVACALRKGIKTGISLAKRKTG